MPIVKLVLQANTGTKYSEGGWENKRGTDGENFKIKTIDEYKEHLT
jgi:hypothetical protein